MGELPLLSPMATLKVISWNVNGIRAVLKKGFLEFLEEHDPDILCLQETKVSNHQAPALVIPRSSQYWHCATRPGYSGTALLSREDPIAVSLDFPGGEHVGEGRLILAEYPKFFLVNVYVPNSKGDLSRLDYRTNVWDRDLCIYLRNLQEEKPVIFCGDLNVAHEPIDLARPEANRKSAGFTDEERAGFANYQDAGLVDSFRYQHPDLAEQYSWWSYRAGARERNVGWRLDYCLLSEPLMDKLEDSFILPDVIGSDHAPVGVLINV